MWRPSNRTYPVPPARRRPLHGPCFGPAASQSPGYFAIAADVNGPGGECVGPTLTGNERQSVMDDDGPTALEDEPTGPAPGRIQMPAMRVLVAPDCYGDSLSAVEAAAAIATGWSRSRPADMFIVAPQSDGGPGFVEVLGSRLGETPAAAGARAAGRHGGSAVGVRSPLGDRLPGMCASMRPGVAWRPAHAGDRAGGRQQRSRAAHRRGTAGGGGPDRGRAGRKCVHRRRAKE